MCTMFCILMIQCTLVEMAYVLLMFMSLGPGLIIWSLLHKPYLHVSLSLALFFLLSTHVLSGKATCHLHRQGGNLYQKEVQMCTRNECTFAPEIGANLH